MCRHFSKDSNFVPNRGSSQLIGSPVFAELAAKQRMIISSEEPKSVEREGGRRGREAWYSLKKLAKVVTKPSVHQLCPAGKSAAHYNMLKDLIP